MVRWFLAQVISRRFDGDTLASSAIAVKLQHPNSAAATTNGVIRNESGKKYIFMIVDPKVGILQLKLYITSAEN